MKLIIAGSRGLDFSPNVIEELVHSLGMTALPFLSERDNIPLIEEIVSGTAEGIDRLGEYYAMSNYVTVKRFPADWGKYGKSAGPIRNKEMAEYADALLLIWDGESKGSRNMKDQMSRMNKPIYEVIVRKVK